MAKKSKEIKFHSNIAEHDYQVKLRNIKKFLTKGLMVHLTVMMRGREIQNPQFAVELLKRVVDDTKDLCGANTINVKDRNVTTSLSPFASNKKAP